MSLVELVFPAFIREVILLGFKELVFLEKMFFQIFDQPNRRKVENVFFHTEHTLNEQMRVTNVTDISLLN